MKIYKDLKQQLYTKGIVIPNEDYYNLIKVWKSWYSGNVDDFHFYNQRLADGTTTQFERKTMSMAKKGAEDMMKLNWSSKCDIKLGTEEKTKALWKVLDSKQNNFTIMFPQMLELAFALGTTAITEYKDSLGRTRIEYINDAQMILPYAYDNFNIIGMILFNQWEEQKNKKKVYYTHLTYHEFKPEINKETGEMKQKYIKYNELYISKDESKLGKEIDFNEMFPNVENPVEYDTDTPHFQIIKPPIANNIEIDNPMGISIFANSIDKLKSIDIKYDEFSQEYIDGKRRILVDKTALKGTPQVDENGNITTQIYFDRNDRTFVAVNGMKDQPIKDIAFDIRKDAFIDGIEADLNWYASSLGFGETFYKMGTGGQATATEILSEDSDAWRTKQTYEVMIRDVVFDIVKAICYLEGIQITDDEIQVEFDYSRFQNEKEDYINEIAAGIRSKTGYLMKFYDMSEEEAKAELNRVNNEDSGEVVGE